MKKNKYILCIDNGLSVSKTALVDFSGNLVRVSSFKTEIINKNGFSEIDMDWFYTKTFAAIKELISSSNIDSGDIAIVGNSAHGAGLYLIDNLGRPVRKAITSMDSRGESLISKWEKEGIDFYSKTYTNMWNGQAIPLLYWLKEHEKDNFQKTNKILFCKDWIKFKLTGQVTTDYTDASNAGLINLRSKNYDPEIYKMYDLDSIYEKLPKLNRSYDIIGYVTKEAAEKTCLREGTPVICGMVDFIACIIGSGLKDTSTYSVVSGTWGINSAIRDNLASNPGINSTVVFPNNNFLVMEISPNSAVNLEWFISEILEKPNRLNLDRKDLYSKINEEISKIDIKESDLFYFPFIYRSKLSWKLEGVIYGFNASDNLYNLIYAIYEGVVFSHLMQINNFRKSNIDYDKVLLSGGAANSKQWCQMFSDILNLKVITTSANEVGILGLAIYQFLGLGLYENLEKAIDKMVKVKSIYEPDEEKANIYKNRFLKFTKMIKLLDQ